MTETQIRNWLGVLLIVLHLLIFAIIFIFYSAGGLNFEEFTTCIAIIIPMFAGYTTSIVIYFQKNRFTKLDSSQRVTGTFVALSVAYPILFFIVIVYCIYAQSYGKLFANFEQFKTTVTVVEATFATYIANFVYSLFEKVTAETPSEKGTTKPTPT